MEQIIQGIPRSVVVRGHTIARPVCFVEQGITYGQGRKTPFLLMTRLGVEGNGNKVPYFGTYTSLSINTSGKTCSLARLIEFSDF